MTGDSVRAALSQLGDVLENLRERLGDGPSPELHPDRDAHALDIFQEILSVPPLGLPPGELFGLAMDRVSRLLAADRALLFVLDDTTGRLVPRSGRGFRRDDLETVVLDPGEGLVGRVFAEKRVLTYDAAAEPSGRDPFVERFPMRQGIAVPVRTEGEVGGVLFAGRQDLGAPFTTTDVLLLLVIADRVGSSLVHQRLLERRGDHIAHLRELRGLVDANLPAREPREILARACDAACRLAGVRGALALAGSGPGRIGVLAGAGLLASVGPERFRADDDVLVDGFAADGPVTIRDLQARRPARPGLFEEEGIRAALLVPMRARGRVVGLLCLADPEPRDFSPEDTESALMLAALTAGALETERQIAESRHAVADHEARPGRRGEGRADARAGRPRGRAHARAPPGLRDPAGPRAAPARPRPERSPARRPRRARGSRVARHRSAPAAARAGGGRPARRGRGAAGRRAGRGELRARASPRRARVAGRDRDDRRSGRDAAGRGQRRRAARGGGRLVLNAMEAMPAGGTLSVRTRGHEGGAELVVVDTGEGIPPEIRPRIFDPFFTTRPGHLGLGLSVAEAVVLRAGGRLEVDRAGAGGGTTGHACGCPRRGCGRPRSRPRPPSRRAPPRPRPGRPRRAPAPSSWSRRRKGSAPRCWTPSWRWDIAWRRCRTRTPRWRGSGRAASTWSSPTWPCAIGRGFISRPRSRSGVPGRRWCCSPGGAAGSHEERLRESGVDVMLVKPVQPDRVREAVADALTLRRPA